MKYNMFVAFDGDDMSAQYIYFEDKETNDLVKAEFGGEDEYAKSDQLEALIYSSEGFPAINVSSLSDEDQQKIYENFTYDPRDTYSFPPLTKVFAGTEYEGTFVG